MGQFSSYSDSFTANTTRYPSPAIWDHIEALDERPGRVVGLFDEFVDAAFTVPTTEGNFGRYKAFSSSGATITVLDEAGTGITITEATADESVCIATRGLPFQIINTGGMLAFEARIKTSSVANTAHNTIVGLMDARTLIVGDPLTVAGALISTLNFVGFQRLEADGDAMDTTFQENGETQVVVEADAAVLAADTFIKVGMLFEPQKKLLTFFVNGVPRATTKTISDTAGDAFPNDVRLGMVFCHMAAATSPGTQSIDWWGCKQHFPAS
jgi:hypothetical protein